MRDNHKQLTYCPLRHEELKSPGPLGILNSETKDLNNIGYSTETVVVVFVFKNHLPSRTL